VCGEAGVAIVEADRLQAVIGDRVEKVARPMNILRGHAHDDQHRRRIAVSDTLIRDVNPGRPDP
jgi:hypothetical protein